MREIGAVCLFLGYGICFVMIIVMALWVFGMFNFEIIFTMLKYGFPGAIILLGAGSVMGGAQYIKENK
jgi:hypothetical protein